MNLIRNTTKFLSIASIAMASLLSTPQVFAQNDAPGRVARVSYSYGNISFADAGSNEWLALIPNRPLSTGDSIFIPELGRAELHIGANAVRLSEKTRLTLTKLSEDSTQIRLSQGSMVLKVRALFERENVEVNTPNLTFSVQEPGEYRFNVNDDNTSTVIVRHGVGVAQGDRDVITLREGEQTRFSGTNLNHSQIARAPRPDTLDQWAYDRDQAEENSVSARYVSREVIGYQQLDEYGNWETHSEHGAIWYPRGISVGWAPYRDGQWIWVAPWGWTWVDRSPWGFAPYHYGRWAHIGSRWGWVPGRDHHRHRPVYAPALVVFVGNGNHGISTSIGVSGGARRHNNHGPSVAWFPLGPNESYYPSYTRNPRYLQNVNYSSNHTTVNNTFIVQNRRDVYVNQRVTNAVTSVPTQTFVRGEHVFPASQSIMSAQIQKMRVAVEGSTLTPERGNRFGDGRSNYRPENETNRDQTFARTNRGETVSPVNSGNGILGNQVQQIRNNADNNSANVPTPSGDRRNNRADARLGAGSESEANRNSTIPANRVDSELNVKPSNVIMGPQILQGRSTTETNAQMNDRKNRADTELNVKPSNVIMGPQMQQGRSTTETNAQMNEQRNRSDEGRNGRMERTERAEFNNPKNFSQNPRQDDANRPQVNNSRFDNRREATQTEAAPSVQALTSAPQTTRPVERSSERSAERPAERNFERNFERRSGDQGFERSMPVQREIQQAPRVESRPMQQESRAAQPEVRREMPQAPRVESRPMQQESRPQQAEVRREASPTPAKSEKERDGKKKENER